jgi:hypothetical protein
MRIGQVKIVLGCWPVDQTALRHLVPNLAHLIPDLPVPGSIQGTCHPCGAPVWVGPRQQLHLLSTPAFCFLCAAGLQIANTLRGVTTQYVSMGGE